MAQQDFSSLLKLLIQNDTLTGIGSKAGTNTAQTKTAVKTALPELLEALSKNTQTEEGAASLYDALDDHDGSVLDNILGTINNGETQADGAKILEHILGGGQTTVVKDVASKSGVTSEQATGILQTIAPLLLETLGKTKQTQGLNASDITGVLSGVLNKQGGGSLLGTLLDQDKDGDFKDDIIAMIVRWIKGFFTKK